jgi:hypothetical protein
MGRPIDPLRKRFGKFHPAPPKTEDLYVFQRGYAFYDEGLHLADSLPVVHAKTPPCLDRQKRQANAYYHVDWQQHKGKQYIHRSGYSERHEGQKYYGKKWANGVCEEKLYRFDVSNRDRDDIALLPVDQSGRSQSAQDRVKIDPEHS